MRKLLQKIADEIISRLEQTDNQQLVDFYIDLGIWLNFFAIGYFDIYLE